MECLKILKRTKNLKEEDNKSGQRDNLKVSQGKAVTEFLSTFLHVNINFEGSTIRSHL